MRALVTGLGILIASSAFAANQPAQGKGDFRHAAAVKAAGFPTEPYRTRVMGVATADKYTKGPANPATSRYLAVQNLDTGAVKLVDAPLDMKEPVKVLSARAANKVGFKTQAQAMKIAAKQTGGAFGIKGIKLEPNGLTWDGHSYNFLQHRPVSETRTIDGVKGTETSISRTVTLAGYGQSANGQFTPAASKPAATK